MSGKKETTGAKEVFRKAVSVSCPQWAGLCRQGRWGVTQAGAERSAAGGAGYPRQVQGGRRLWLRQSFHAEETQLEHCPPADQVHSLGYGQKGLLPLHGLLNPSHPVISFLLGAGVNLIHLRAGRRSTDEKHASLLISNLSSDELLEGNNGWLLVLHKRGGRAGEAAPYLQ